MGQRHKALWTVHLTGLAKAIFELRPSLIADTS